MQVAARRQQKRKRIRRKNKRTELSRCDREEIQEVGEMWIKLPDPKVHGGSHLQWLLAILMDLFGPQSQCLK